MGTAGTNAAHPSRAHSKQRDGTLSAAPRLHRLLPGWVRLGWELWPNPSGVNPLPPLLPQVVLKGDAWRLNVHGVSGAASALGWGWG